MTGQKSLTSRVRTATARSLIRAAHRLDPSLPVVVSDNATGGYTIHIGGHPLAQITPGQVSQTRPPTSGGAR